MKDVFEIIWKAIKEVIELIKSFIDAIKKEENSQEAE